MQSDICNHQGTQPIREEMIFIDGKDAELRIPFKENRRTTKIRNETNCQESRIGFPSCSIHMGQLLGTSSRDLTRMITKNDSCNTKQGANGNIKINFQEALGRGGPNFRGRRLVMPGFKMSSNHGADGLQTKNWIRD